MATLEIKDEEALRVLAQAIKGLIEKNSEYFFQQQSYHMTQHISSAVRSACEKIANEQIMEVLKEKNYTDQIRVKVAELITDDLITQLITQVKVKVGGY